MKLIYRSILFSMLTMSPSLQAWDNHALPTAIALSVMPEVSRLAKVKAEPLEDFLRAEQRRLVEVLRAEENWARTHLSFYPPRPGALTFDAVNKDSRALFLSFIKAIRVNPNMSFPLFVQELPGQAKQASYLPLTQVTLMPNSLTPTGNRFIGLKAGELIAPLDVFASATDEPDYGLDIGLWEDSGTAFGREYGFGPQPFGNPKLEFATQAPFHMAFHHEASCFYKIAGYLARTLPEYRVHLFSTLSRFAFSTGHAYWGWRFAGWGAHYVQDLTQPYHTTVVPGENTLKMLFVGLLDLVGIEGPKSKLLQRVSDEHLTLEHDVYCLLMISLKNQDRQNLLIQALEHQEHEKSVSYTPAYIRDVLTEESHRYADDLAVAIEQFPTTAKSNRCDLTPKTPQLRNLFQKLMNHLGRHTRNWVRGFVSAS